MKPGRFLCLLLVLAAAASGGGCRGSTRAVGDVDEIRLGGRVRFVVRPGYSESQGVREGAFDETLLLEQLAARLGVEPVFIEASRNDQLATMVRNGDADIAISRFSPKMLESIGLAATTAVDWVEDLVVAGRAAPADDAEDAGAGSLHMHRSRVTEAVLDFAAAKSLEIVEVPEEVSIDEVLRRVQSGRYSMTVADSELVLRAARNPRLRVVERLGGPRELVWGVRENNPRLRLAIDHFLFAEKVLARTAPTAACRDLQEIRSSGYLRLVTRNSATTCTIEHGGLEGFEYELVSHFARRLGVRVELAIPPPDEDPISWLRRGHGDLAALHEPVAPEDEGSLLVTVPYRRVDLVALMSAKARPVGGVVDLAGVRMAASRPVASLATLMPLSAPLRPRSTPLDDAFTAVTDVLRGRLPVAVVDEDAAKLELANWPDLSLGPVVVPNVDLVWLLNASSPRLHAAANRFLSEVRKSGVVKQLVLNEFGSWEPPRDRSLLPIPDGALSPYDELLQWVGRRYEIDWRLLASLMYEESRFDAEAVGPGGSAGLFQFMPMTWPELGVEDPHHPQEAAEAGARYLRQLMDEFIDLPLPDRVAMAVASYNVGPRHVFDARTLASEMGFDPNRWKGSVETAMLIKDDPEVARNYPAGVCRCRRAVGYTRRILRRYAAYTTQFPPA